MIIQIYALLLGLALVFLFYGYYSKSDLFRLFGMFLVIVLGIVLSGTVSVVFGQLNYQNGTVQAITNTSIVTTYSYAVYSDVTIGLFLFLYGVFGFIIVLMEHRDQ